MQIKNYDKVAKQYADAFYNELSKKPLDNYLLEFFYRSTRDGSQIIDFGCGVGHVSKYISDLGGNIKGIDISEGMINTARDMNPNINFETGDILKLDLKSNSLGGAILFYSIVHFTLEEIDQLIKTLYSALEDNGYIFVCFHEGNEVLHVDSLLGETVDMDYIFYPLDTIVDLLKQNRFTIVEAISRYPYVGYEYETKKASIICKK